MEDNSHMFHEESSEDIKSRWTSMPGQPPEQSSVGSFSAEVNDESVHSSDGTEGQTFSEDSRQNFNGHNTYNQYGTLNQEQGFQGYGQQRFQDQEFQGQGFQGQAGPGYNPYVNNSSRSKDYSSYARTSMVFGIISLILFLTFFNFIFAIMAIIFGFFGLKTPKKKQAVVGIVTAVLSIALLIGSMVIISTNTKLIKDITQYSQDEAGNYTFNFNYDNSSDDDSETNDSSQTEDL